MAESQRVTYIDQRKDQEAPAAERRSLWLAHVILNRAFVCKQVVYPQRMCEEKHNHHATSSIRT